MAVSSIVQGVWPGIATIQNEDNNCFFAEDPLKPSRHHSRAIAPCFLDTEPFEVGPGVSH